MRTLKLGAISLPLTLMAVSAFATPSTLIWIPSTDIQPDKVTHITYDNYVTPGSSVPNIGVYGLTYGVGNKIELGFDYITNVQKPWVFNAKALLADEKENMPRVVVGAYNVALDNGSDALPNPLAQDLIYLLTSKTFNGTRFHIGYAWGRKKALLTDQNMLLLGIDRTLNDKWWIGADYQGGKSALGTFNIGTSYKFATNASLLLGYDWYNDSAIKDTITIQLDVDIAKF